MSEAELYQQVEGIAHLHGWLIAHFRPAQTSRGWRTPVQGDGAGFPDVVLARRGVVLLAELKRPDGALSAAQVKWADALLGPGWEGVWRPQDLESGAIEEALR